VAACHRAAMDGRLTSLLCGGHPPMSLSATA
jgi:hypothetical protein